jgi:molybdate transport system ATP-binding protein
MPLLCSIEKDFGPFALRVHVETEDEVMALLGASGCGKSMTLRCIAGVVKPDAGRIELNGAVLFDAEKRINVPPQRRRVGFLFQDYALFPNMTVEQNIRAGAGRLPKGERQAAVRRMVEAFRLRGLEQSRPGQLSGGQKQRCALARMMADDPEILLLDEPFSALDSFLRWQLEQELGEMLRHFAKPVLFVSHNRDEVFRLCRRITVMKDGENETPAEKHALFGDPKTCTAALLTGCKNITPVRTVGRRVFADAWGFSFESGGDVDGITHLGIRAKQIEPAFGAKHRRHCVRFVYEIVRETEEAFGYILMIRPKGTQAAPLRWELNRAVREELNRHPPEAGIAKEHLLLLSG